MAKKKEPLNDRVLDAVDAVNEGGAEFQALLDRVVGLKKKIEVTRKLQEQAATLASDLDEVLSELESELEDIDVDQIKEHIAKLEDAVETVQDVSELDLETE